MPIALKIVGITTFCGKKLNISKFPPLIYGNRIWVEDSVMWDFTNIASCIGGGLILLYLISQVIYKVFSGVGMFKNISSKRQENTDKYYKKLAKEIINETVMPELKELKSQVAELKETDIDSLRAQITEIYNKYLPKQKIPQIEKESCSKLVSRYLNLGGNCYVETIWNEMKEWETVISDADIF